MRVWRLTRFGGAGEAAGAAAAAGATSLSWAMASASRAGLGGDLAGATSASAAGTMVGWVVSNTTALGHLWAEWIRIAVRSTEAAVASAAVCGVYQSISRMSASSKPPTKTKYRRSGMEHDQSLPAPGC